MTDHIANNRLSLAFGRAYARIPLRAAPYIVHGDALELDWSEVLAPEKCSYVLGNPPFIGFVMRGEAQQEQASALMERLGSGGSRLDYVAAWFLKAGEYVQRSHARIAFVATNSITQGEQVPQLWPALFDRFGLEVEFAHRTFAWGSDARGKAHVHVVIVGLSRRVNETASKRLFSYRSGEEDPVESRHASLTAYLFGGETVANRHLLVRRTTVPLEARPELRVGSKPVDGGHFILGRAERDALIARHPDVSPYVRPFVGGHELINGGDRWLIVLRDAPPQSVRRWPEVINRIEAVRRFRETEAGKLGRSLAQTPGAFHVTVIPQRPYLAIPEVSSERRTYVPIAWLAPPTIPSNQLLVVLDASLLLFGMLTSASHIAWLAHIGGRLKSDFRYSGGLVYNTFPWPEVSATACGRIERLAQAVLDARAEHAGATLADLYDPDLMPANLRKAHRALDAAVDRLYRPAPFDSDRERVEHLFGLYERMVAGFLAMPAPTRRGRRRAVLP